MTMLKPTPGYIPGIDGLRAIAVLAVLIYHADYVPWLPGGFTGVDMFFVISGFVISQSLSERKTIGFADYLSTFYRSRILRLLPALLVVLTVSFVLSGLLLPQVWLSEQNNRTGMAAFLGLSNFVLAFDSSPYFSPSVDLNPYLHTWSLGVEEQFYLLFPGIWYLWLRYRQRGPAFWAVLPILTLASLAISTIQTAHDPLAAFYLLPSRFWELAAGALLYQWLHHAPLRTRSSGAISRMMVVGLGLLLAGFVYADAARFPLPWALATVAGTLLMISALVQPHAGELPIPHRLLQSRPALYVGRLSYSLYLWHWPVAVFIRWTVGFELLAVQLIYPLLVLGSAAASYHWIESPIRAGRGVLQMRTWVTAGAAAAMVALAMMGARWISENPDRVSLSRTADTYTWMAYRHAPPASAQPIHVPHLQGHQLFALGDSHTAAYRTLLKQVSAQLGVRVIEHERGGCSVVRLIGADPTECAEDREAALQAIEAAAKPGDMVFLASLRMPELAGRNWTGDPAATWATVLSEVRPRDRAAGMASAHATLSRLQAAGLQIVIDAPIPVFMAPANRCSDWFNRMNPICAPGLSVPRARLEAMRAGQMLQLELLRQQYPALTVWDPFPLLCPGVTCSAFDEDGAPLYFDGDHLSGHGNRILANNFIQLLLQLWDSEPSGSDE
ncbi:acyltransferase family protein [Stenotrophomonas sp. TWI700]|uniref:acyltransferase family protein n=1 Tax=Stenotrophomonas sp. TWI700 TaxID=3136792 RepID=UPI00320AD157